MPPQGLDRKLTAILSADVEGYSLLMGDDEEATVWTLTEYRKVMGSLIQQDKGRVVDSPGDNLLAEFASVVDAVNCAVKIQRHLAERNGELPETRRMQFRIGLNLGDVVMEGERIYGDGVNIAARMEGLAEGGGICLSGAAHDAIENKTGLQFEYLGEQEVKNISKPVRAYRVIMGTEAGGIAPGQKKEKSRVWRKVAIALGVIVALLVGAATVIWNVYFRLPDVKGLAGRMQEFDLPEGPSIAVLPFDNMSGDPEQEYFSDGLTENLIAGLSGDGRILVIARNSTFAYKGKSPDIQRVAQKLGVQYVVEGSVQKTENRVRITAQLIDGKTGNHVWADRYDREMKDIFALQDEITLQIMGAVGMKLVHGEQYGEELLPPSGSLEVVNRTMKAREYFFRNNKEANIRARQEIEKALTLDPEYSVLYALLAFTHLLDVPYQSSESPLISFAQASKNIKKALELDDENWFSYLALSHLYLLRKEHDEAIGALERAIVLNPNGADAYDHLGFVLCMSGRPDEGIKLIGKAMRLNPIPPPIYLIHLGVAYYLLGRYEEAIEVQEEVLEHSPNSLFAHIWLAAAYSASGREKKARHQAEELAKVDPAFSLDKYAEMIFFKEESKLERFIGDLRKAGLK
jgi:adenylate cyclase